MHCRRNLLRCGIQLFKERQNRRLLSLSQDVAWVVKSSYPEFIVPTESIPQHVWSRCEEWSDNIAFECGVTGRSYTYGATRKLCRRFAASLHRAGLQAGSTLAIVMPNSPEWPIVFLGALEAGFVVTTINPTYTADEISKQLQDSQVKVIVTLSAIHSTIMTAVKISVGKNNPLVIIAPGFQQGSQLPAGSIDLMEMLQKDINTSVRISGDFNDTAVLPYSSGTTGLPKGVMLSHKNFVSACSQLNCLHELCLTEPAVGSHQDICPVIMPFFHIYGMTVLLLAKMLHGVKMVTLPRFEPTSFFNLLDKHEVRFMNIAPPLVLFLATHPGLQKRHIRALKYVSCGAAPLPRTDIHRFLERAPRVSFMQGFGMTETTSVGLRSRPYDKNYESVGVPIPNTEVKISHPESGATLACGEIGELCMRGPQVMKGYYNRPDATSDTIDSEGWLHTGDIGHYDDKNHFYIVDRLKELIKVKGFQVAPAELEQILRSHPQIEDAAVVGIPDVKNGEVPKAYVVPKGSKISQDDVKKFVAEKVSEYKHLKGGVQFIDKIPKSPSGKILRRILKEQL
ncbi:uncharacterized protein [Periplaneta americana]|uniref:uncharacterized protein n=1 Tax=Periplaneta americana TaxID=6978 RepID=UPI0037E7DD5F